MHWHAVLKSAVGVNISPLLSSLSPSSSSSSLTSCLVNPLTPASTVCILFEELVLSLADLAFALTLKMHLLSWEFAAELWSVAWPSFTLVQHQICVCPVTHVFLLMCDSSVSQHGFFGLLPFHLTRSLSLHGMQATAAGSNVSNPCMRTQQRVRTVVRAPKRLFEVCSTAEQGNKP